MMAKGLRIAEPPPRRPIQVEAEETPEPPASGEKAIRTRRKVPQLLAEALELLQARHGRV
jgi:hypothetical protein